MGDEPPRINLKVLSPSTEVEGDISLRDVPASTTVKELRLRLQNEIATKPSTERMRLIYRGKVVALETSTLMDVFGAENIRDSKDQTLHLVLRELVPPATSSSSPAPTTSTAPPNPFRPVQTPPQPPQPPPQPNNPFRPFQQPPRPNSQPPGPHHHHAHGHAHPHVHHHHHLPQQQNAFAPLFPPGLFPPPAMLNPPHNPTPDAQSAHSRSGTPASNPPSQPSAPSRAATPNSAAPNLQPNSTTTVRHETVGPNGERWTITRTNANFTIGQGPPQQVPVLPRPFPHPAGFPIPLQPPPMGGGGIDAALARARAGLLNARQQMENIRRLSRPDNTSSTATSTEQPGPLSVPPYRMNHIRGQLRSLSQQLDQVQQNLTILAQDPSMAENQELITLQRSTTELTGNAQNLINVIGGAASQNETHASTSQTQSSSQTATDMPSASASPPEFYVVSSPQGPVGVLIDQRGMYSTAPLNPTMPFQAFSQHFDHNRQMIAGISQQIAQNSAQLQHRLAVSQPQPVPGGPDAANQAAPQVQNANANANAAQPVANDNDRLNMWAGHAWLIFKLLIFVYIFAGHGGWYRPVMMGLVAAGVYLAQIGIFEAQFNRVRHHFEALLPMADREGPNRQGAANAAQPAGPRVEPGRNLTPEQAAQRLLQQHQNQNPSWMRQSMRTAERAFAIFVASLWPGIGERMVQAQEERERQERAAEEERQREEEQRREREAKEKEEREQEQEEREKNGEAVATESSTEQSQPVREKKEGDDLATTQTSSSKGKARAEVVDEEEDEEDEDEDEEEGGDDTSSASSSSSESST